MTNPAPKRGRPPGALNQKKPAAGVANGKGSGKVASISLTEREFEMLDEICRATGKTRRSVLMAGVEQARQEWAKSL